MKLIKDDYGRISVLGLATGERPHGIQDKPFKDNPIIHSAYPLDGGAVMVDVNDVDILRDVTQADIDSMNDTLATDRVIELFNRI